MPHCLEGAGIELGMKVVGRHASHHLGQAVSPLAQDHLVAVGDDLDGRAFPDAPLLGNGLGMRTARLLPHLATCDRAPIIPPDIYDIYIITTGAAIAPRNPADSKPTIKEVARRAGVALSSVSRVLNDHPDVSENMRSRC